MMHSTQIPLLFTARSSYPGQLSQSAGPHKQTLDISRLAPGQPYICSSANPALTAFSRPCLVDDLLDSQYAFSRLSAARWLTKRKNIDAGNRSDRAEVNT